MEKKSITYPLSQFAAKTRDDAVRMASTSGGVFTELSKAVFATGGIVIGAGWMRDPFRVALKVANNEQEIADMRGSKYVFSEMPKRGDIPADAHGLFTGLPCQIAGVRRIYGDRFIYCALICHSTPEPKVWNKYVQELERQYHSKLVLVQFRAKRNVEKPWRNSAFVADFESGAQHVDIEGKNIFTSAYFRGHSTRLSCLKCKFKCGHHGADLVIGDFWGIEDVLPDFDDGKGVNAVLAYSKRGEELLRQANLSLVPVTYGQIFAKNPHLEVNVNPNPKRRRCFMLLYRFLGIWLASRIACSRLGGLF